MLTQGCSPFVSFFNPTDNESDPGAEKAWAQAAVEPRDEGLGNLRDSLEGYSQSYHEGYDYVAFDAEGFEYGCAGFWHGFYSLGIFAHNARKHHVESGKNNYR